MFSLSWAVCISLCLFVLVMQPPRIQSSPLPKSRKKALAAGLLTGAVAGVVLDRALTSSQTPVQHIHHHQSVQQIPNSNANAPSPSPSPGNPIGNQVTIIEKGETLPNGCYKQTVREPDPHDNRKFVETVQWICPSVTPATPLLTVPVMPGAMQVLPMPPAALPAPPPAPGPFTIPVAPQASPGLLPTAVLPMPIESTVPLAPLHPAAGNPVTSGTPLAPFAPAIPVMPTNQLPAVNSTPTIMPEEIPTQIPRPPLASFVPVAPTVSPVTQPNIQTLGTPQVFVVSKKSGFYPTKSSVPGIQATAKWIVVLSMLFSLLF